MSAHQCPSQLGPHPHKLTDSDHARCVVEDRGGHCCWMARERAAQPYVDAQYAASGAAHRRLEAAIDQVVEGARAGTLSFERARDLLGFEPRAPLLLSRGVEWPASWPAEVLS